MAVICPTVTAYDQHQYRAHMELIEPFAKRIHIDLMDGEFAPTVSPPPDQVWWPDGITADIHIMFQRPAEQLEQLIALKPHLVVIQFEADVDHVTFAAGLHEAGIKAGLGLLQATTVKAAAATLGSFDHVMIFSGNLGHHGSVADLGLLDKIRQVRELYPDIEVAWDGGINDQNAKQLVKGGADVLNVGSFIHKAEDPSAAYAKLEAVIGTV
jgi:ribulose-phosphate 3-epimerase